MAFPIRWLGLFALVACLTAACGGSSNPGGLSPPDAGPDSGVVAVASICDGGIDAPDVTGVGPLTDAGAPMGQAITGCGALAGSAQYFLTGDLSAPSNTACLTIADAGDVTVDCQGHAITGALQITDAQNVTLRNCAIALLAGDVGFPVDVESSSAVTFDHDDLGGGARVNALLIKGVSGLTFTRNRLRSEIDAQWVSGGLFQNNLFSLENTGCVGAINLGQGHSNRILNNEIDGHWDGARNSGERLGNSAVGCDDGIGIADEVGDEIAGNHIANVYDCGIENDGAITDAFIHHNQIDQAPFCGIGGWYWSSLARNTIACNTVRGSTTLFQFQHFYGLRPADVTPFGTRPADDAVLFEDNVFDRNVLLDPPADVSQSYGAWIPIFHQLDISALAIAPGETAPADADFKLTNNRFRHNDFGSAGPPYFGWSTGSPSDWIIDEGGNHCRPGGAPLVCH